VSPAGYPASTDAFDFSMPPVRNILGLSGVSGGRAAVDGQQILLAPLSPGRHVIAEVVHYRAYEYWVWLYHLRVSAGPPDGCRGTRRPGRRGSRSTPAAYRFPSAGAAAGWSSSRRPVAGARRPTSHQQALSSVHACDPR
jgi:hypothetical protein